MLRRSFLSLFPIPFLSSLPVFKTEDVPELKFELVEGLHKMANAEELMLNMPFVYESNSMIRRRLVKLNDIVDGSQGSFTGEGILNAIKTKEGFPVVIYLVTESENSKKVKIVHDYESRDV
jgi:hypothetical protein